MLQLLQLRQNSVFDIEASVITRDGNFHCFSFRVGVEWTSNVSVTIAGIQWRSETQRNLLDQSSGMTFDLLLALLVLARPTAIRVRNIVLFGRQ